ncbi:MULTISPECIES: helix-turn-helix domain-containing protein [Paenibacillus]|uniref:helix-turn-helix domain-containing protein n=1 Tax=Paenibacillus TaxID=44249 RepID=UPI003342A297
MSQEKIINRVNELLNSSNLQQKQLAEALHTKSQTFNGYMRGHRPFPLEIVVGIADFFEVSVDYVLGRSDER